MIGADRDRASASRLMLVLMFMGLHVATVMVAVAMVGAIGWLGTPAVFAFGNQLWAATEDYVLLSIPLYILLGEILVRGGATDRMYHSLADWLKPLPGGLLHTNIGCLGALLGRFGFVGGDGGDHLHHRAAGLQAPRLRPAPGAGLDRRRREPGQSHPAGHRLPGLWRHDQHFRRVGSTRPACCPARS